jgi:ankyrin repeat domain-containing protein 50
VLNWLSTTDSSANHNSARKLHEGDTGSWLIHSRAYSEWYDTGGRFLWLYGIAGSGKTVLCSTLIEDVKRRTEADAKGDVAVGYFYFDFQDKTKQSTNNLVRTLIRQLSSSESVTWRNITCLYDKYSGSGQMPADSVLLDLLIKIIEDRDQTFILIDAFDECTEKEDAVDTIIETFSRISSKLSVFITSRPDTYIEDCLRDIDAKMVTKIAGRNAAVDKDISDFVKARMEKDRKLRRWRSEANYIIETLVNQAGGM